MWAFRRAANPLRNQGLGLGISPIYCASSEFSDCCLLDNNARCDGTLVTGPNQPVSARKFYSSRCDAENLFSVSRTFSSQAGIKSGDEEDSDLEKGFSELELPTASDEIQESKVEDEDDELISEPDLSEEEMNNDDGEGPRNELGAADTETDISEKRSSRQSSSKLFNVIVAAPGLSVDKVMDKWVEGGNELSRSEISLAMLNLRKRRMYGRALQLSEWLESSKRLDFVERDYASRLDLIYKVRGLQKAEKYIEKIPKSFRGELVYRTFLANCAAATNVKKSEEVFNKMKDLGFPLTAFACNQLLLVYKRIDKKKIADVLLLMEKENVKPSLFTYKILIDVKGQSNDTTGMDQIFETMKAEGIEPDLHTKASLAKHYIAASHKEKAEAILKEMEGGDPKANRWACCYLLNLYADLGKADEVARIWQQCESNPRAEECLAAIEAWGKLKKIEEAEAVFDKMASKWRNLSSKYYSILLKVYANHKMLSKGKELVKRMADSGCHIGPLTWDSLVNLYIEAGEVEKADSLLQKAVEQNRNRPMFRSYMTIMDQYSRKGDVHNTEKIFHRMRQAGYFSRLNPYRSLIQAYINSKTPAYGIRERMKADSIFPNKQVAGLLAQVDAFKKTSVSDLLD